MREGRKDARVVINAAAALQRTKKLRDQPDRAAATEAAVAAMPAKSKHSWSHGIPSIQVLVRHVPIISRRTGHL